MDIDDEFDLQSTNQADNNVVITNRVYYDEKRDESINNQIIRAINFIPFMNQTEQKKKALKEKILSSLADSRDRIIKNLYMIELSIKENNQIQFKPIFPLKSSISTSFEPTLKRKLQRVNFLKKKDHFSQTIQTFKDNLKKLKETSVKYQDIFKQLLELKKLGFYVEENVKLKEELAQEIKIELQNNYILNFEDFIPIQKHNFILEIKENGNESERNYSLTSKYYQNFSSRYKIVFEFELQLDGSPVLHFTQFQMESIINQLLEQKIPITECSIYFKSIKQYLLLYFKYLLYKFINIEIDQLIKANKGKNTFIFQGFCFIIDKKGRELSICANYYNQFQFSLKCGKIPLQVLKKQQDENKKEIIDLSSHVAKIAKIFFGNLFYNIKLSSVIKDFYGLTKNKPSFDDIIDNGILIKNIVKTSKIFLHRLVMKKINFMLQQLTNYTWVNENIINQEYDSFKCKFILIKNNVVNPFFSRIEIILEFTYKGEVKLEIKNSYKNIIFAYDRDCFISEKFKRFDMNYLNMLINNLLE